MKKAIIIVSACLIFITGVFAYLWIDLSMYAKTPLDKKQTPQTFTVKSGQSFRSTLELLISEGLIKNKNKFTILAKIKNVESKIKAGEYLLSAAMSPDKILGLLVSGKVQLYKLTIPEGLNLWQIADLVEKAGFCTRSEFIETATDETLVKSFKLEGNTFEGYLYPETYFFPSVSSAKNVIRTMVRRFNTIYKPEWQKRASDLGFTKLEVLTLASIIEKETGVAFERPIISSVFHNRLKKRMRLETDPTVIYGIKDFDGNITKKHLRTKTPYNTYKIKGLPPGPIANPGSKAIEAALYPSDTEYLYFVSKKDSTHKFSTNINDHNRAVRKYQLSHRYRKNKS